MPGTDPAAILGCIGSRTSRAPADRVAVPGKDDTDDQHGNPNPRYGHPNRPHVRRGWAAALLALAAPAVSFLPVLTTNVHGSGAAVTFPNGYSLMLGVTIAVTVVACALGALAARRAALVAIPVGLALWFIIGLAVTFAGAILAHHAHLLGWGIALMAAAAAGAAAGLPLAARR